MYNEWTLNLEKMVGKEFIYQGHAGATTTGIIKSVYLDEEIMPNQVLSNGLDMKKEPSTFISGSLLFQPKLKRGLFFKHVLKIKSNNDIPYRVDEIFIKY